MDRRDLPPLRSLPRIFLPGCEPDEPIPLPKEEVDKLRKVLRLGPGAEVAVLPDDGRLFRCEFDGRYAVPIREEHVEGEAPYRLTIAQALPKPDKLDEVVRMGTEIGVAAFVVFPSERSVVRWSADKLADRLRRLRSIAREAAEVCFRTRLPSIEAASNLDAVFAQHAQAIVLSEVEGVPRHLLDGLPAEAATVVIGPEGGWAPREVTSIGDRARTLGPRVLRVDTAAAAAATLLLLGRTP